MQYTLEICVEDIATAIAAQNNGATRLEICSSLALGGLTPSVGLVKEILKNCILPVRVMIRPRANDFIYTDFEKAIMLEDIKNMFQYDIEGIVIGALYEDGELDVAFMQQVCELVKQYNKKITLHRCFDMVKDPFKTIKEAQSLEIDTILTSGQQQYAKDGIELVNKLTKYNVEIMIGSGVDYALVDECLHKTNIKHFHMSATKVVKQDVFFKNLTVKMGSIMEDEYEKIVPDVMKLKNVDKVLKQYFMFKLK